MKLKYLFIIALCWLPAASALAEVELLHVSYDPTRELFRQYNRLFSEHWKHTTGQVVTVRQSHGGSGSQARAVIEGLRADVVTLALAYDVDAIAEHARLLPTDWRSRWPHNSTPFYSTLIFLVRQGNPRNIRDWSDLARPDVQVITANPKTSGVARWNYLAFWGYALRRELGEDFLDKLSDPKHVDAVADAQRKAEQFVQTIYRNVPVLDRGARGATHTFIQRGIGDVLVSWENEILQGAHEWKRRGFEIVIPPTGIRAEPVVAILDRNVDRRGTRQVVEAYVEYLYSEAGQEQAARHFYRPVSSMVMQRHAHRFPPIDLFTIDEVFGGWKQAHQTHFAEGGTFDRIQQSLR